MNSLMRACRDAPQLLLAIAIGVWLSLAPFTSPLQSRDSTSYLHFDPNVSTVYPMFLELLTNWIGMDLKLVVYVQLWLFIFALAFLGYVVRRISASMFAAPAVVTLIGLNPYLTDFHYRILSDSLFVTVTMLVIAAMILVIEHGSRRRWMALAALIGLALTLRHVGWALVPLVPILALLERQRLAPSFVVTAGLVIASFLVPLGLERAAYELIHDAPRTSLAGQHFFAKGALIEVNDPNPFSANDPRARIWDHVENEIAPVRQIIRDAPSFGVRKHLLSNYELHLQKRFISKELSVAARESGISKVQLQLDVGLARIASAPLAYIGLSWNHFRALLTPLAVSHPVDAKLHNAYLKSRSPIPLHEGLRGRLGQAIVGNPVGWLVQPIVLAASTVLIVLTGFATYRILCGSDLSRMTRIAYLTALMMMGNYMLVSLTAIGIFRYFLAMWPAMMVSLVFLVLAGTEKFANTSSTP